jgi:hypothetical protein
MPTQKRPGKRHLYVEIPEALGEALDALAARNRRTITAEVIIALEAHLGLSAPEEPQKAAAPKGKKRTGGEG